MDRVETMASVRARSEAWDVVVIGGGATGAGCALDAASRGLDVLLLERHDFGKGTSSRSTKLIHGGVRYLREFDISLVREALNEREILLRNAPHVVRPLAFIIPCQTVWQKLYYGTGLKLYDLLAGRNSFGRSRSLSRSALIEAAPSLKAHASAGGIRYFDGQFDDTRLLIDILRTASGTGAKLLNYAAVESFIENGEEGPDGVMVRDRLSDQAFPVRARAVINATGAFCDRIRQQARISSPPLVKLSQGAHIVLDGGFLDGSNAILVPETTDGRVVFCLPWHRHALIGTTETPIDATLEEPVPLEAEIEFLLDAAGGLLTRRPKRTDVKSSFAGIRPLVDDASARNTASLSRSELIKVERKIITVTGGKWTTYRRMAERTVDEVMRVLGMPVKSSRTADIKIIPPRDSSGGALLHTDHQYTVADVVRAIRSEMAQTVEDVLARRTRMLFLDVHAAVACAPRVAEIIARETTRPDYDPNDDVRDFVELAEAYLPQRAQ